MSGFSASDAALEGFHVIRRHWRVVAGWALFNVVGLVAMVVLTVVVAIGVTAVQGGAAAETSGALGGFVAMLGTALIQVILVCGLYRLMLRPEEPGFLHLRVGRDELRLLGVYAAVMLAFFLLIGATVLAMTLVRRLGPVATAPVGIVGFAVAVWLGLRLSLAAPASFAERRFALAASWRMTRGRVWSLFGMSLLAACLVALVALGSSLVMIVIGGLGAGFGAVLEAITDPQAVSTHPGLYLGQMAFELVLAPVMIILGAAPPLAAYLALREAREA